MKNTYFFLNFKKYLSIHEYLFSIFFKKYLKIHKNTRKIHNFFLSLFEARKILKNT